LSEAGETVKYTPQKFFDNIADTYSKRRPTDDYLEIEWKIVRKHLKKGDKILDMCCGSGTFLVPLHQEGYDVEGIEISGKMIEKAFEKNESIRIHQQDARKTDKPDDHYDMVLLMGDSIGVIPDCIDRISVIRECARVLKPGGRFVLTFGNRNSNLDIYMSTLKNFMTTSQPFGTIKYVYKGFEGLHHNYSKAEMDRILRQYGLNKIDGRRSMHKEIVVANV
jgi:SAM-dependent methyltransferase